MLNSSFYVLVFDLTRTALQAQTGLEGRVPFLVMPAPRTVSLGCGLALRVEEENYPQLEQALAANILPAAGWRLYHLNCAVNPPVATALTVKD